MLLKWQQESMRLCMVTRDISGSLIKWAYWLREERAAIQLSFLYFYQPIKYHTLWINLKLKMLSIISLLYKRNYVTVRIICNISNACKHLNIGCTSLIHFWIGTAGCMVNMQQFMKATSILAVGSHSMIEYAIQFLFMNMATDHFNCPIFLPPPH